MSGAAKTAEGGKVPEVSVIVPTFNRWSHLPATIESALAQKDIEFEVLIVDQTAQPPALPGTFSDPRIKYFQVTPPSLPGARNFGIARARAEIIVFIDDDVELEPGFLRAHADRYKDASIGAISGRVVGGPKSTGTIPQILPDSEIAGSFESMESGPTNCAMGCNMSFRREALLKIGGFDTSFVRNAMREDSDACARTLKAGWKIWFEPAATLVHLAAVEGGCEVRGINWARSAVMYRNQFLYLLKHSGVAMAARVAAKFFRNFVWAQKKQPREFAARGAALARGFGAAALARVFPNRLEQREVSAR